MFNLLNINFPKEILLRKRERFSKIIIKKLKIGLIGFTKEEIRAHGKIINEIKGTNKIL